MSDLSRRNLLRNIAATAAAGGVSLEAAQHVHNLAAAETVAGGPYKPKAFTDHEYRTLQALADLIIPSGGASPSASKAGAPEFIDLLASQNPHFAGIFTGGIGWLDHAMRRYHSTTFLEAKPEQQTALLDLIAYRKNESPELSAGIRFFDWARRLVVDAYYTSPAGIKDVGYLGNTAVAKFEVPDEAIQYALKRSPV